LSNNIPKCAQCNISTGEKACYSLNGRNPKFCPTVNNEKTIEYANQKYNHPENKEFARQAAIQEGTCYIERDASPSILHPVKTRLQEICEFSWRMGYKRLGLAFCVGLSKEASIFESILDKQGFEVVSVACKVGCVPKEAIDLVEEEKVRIGGHESMCNPIAQAEVLNQASTDFNVIMGLCVGHDSLFLKHAKALTTVFAVKDRVLAHNPLGALYTSHSYYQRFLRKPIDFKK